MGHMLSPPSMPVPLKHMYNVNILRVTYYRLVCFSHLMLSTSWNQKQSWDLKLLMVRLFSWRYVTLTLSELNSPLSSWSTTSRELLSQFSTCSGSKWFDVVLELLKIVMNWSISFMEIFILKPFVVGKLSMFSGMYNDAWMHREGLKG